MVLSPFCIRWLVIVGFCLIRIHKCGFSVPFCTVRVTQVCPWCIDDWIIAVFILSRFHTFTLTRNPFHHMLFCDVNSTISATYRTVACQLYVEGSHEASSHKHHSQSSRNGHVHSKALQTEDSARICTTNNKNGFYDDTGAIHRGNQTTTRW